jgi:propionate CoA-transferase
VTYSVARGVRERGQTALVVTERAVFEYRSNGLTLTELAPGVDLDRAVLAQMEFAPIVDRSALREMDRQLFAQVRKATRQSDQTLHRAA